MKRSVKFVLFTLLILAFVLSACKPVATAVPTEAINETVVEEVAEAGEETTEIEETEVVDENNTDLSGTITVLTNRTDLVDTVFVEYAAKFNEIYPNITVEFEAMTDYEGEVQIRMSTTDYGDVLLISDSVPMGQLGDFFEPLGSVEELDSTYNFVTEKAIGGTVYGIAVTGNAQGVVYNKAVFEAAGITEMPKSPEEFLAAMQLIKDNTDAIPVYTNYAAGWPLGQWESHRMTVSGDPDYNNKMVHMDAPFAAGTAHYNIYNLMYDLVAQGLTETDPTTTDWEASKVMMGNGEIGCMFLGSWAVTQMQDNAEDPSTIGYMPFPFNIDGVQYAAAGGDYKIAVNKNSENKEAALAWLWWFLNESNFAYDQGGIPPLKDADYPPTLADFQAADVVFVPSNPAPAGEEGLFDLIDTTAEIGLWSDPWKQEIVDAARGAIDKTFDELMDVLNQKWAAARLELGID